MPRVKLTDPYIENKLTRKGKRYAAMDSLVPGFGVRVSERGTRTFVLRTRYPGGDHASWREIGKVGAMTLEKAREKARNWLSLIAGNIDPSEQEERQRLEAQRRRKNTFAAVVADFKAEKLAKERAGDEVEKEIDREFMPSLGGRPITEITDDEIAALITVKARKRPSAARNMLATAKRLFQWAIDQRAYGLKISPAAGLKPKALCGEKMPRNRILHAEKDEITALWRAARKLGYPYGPVYKLLMLTGLRLNEVAAASWQEIDERNGKWTIPGRRMKGKGKGLPHEIPLTDDIKRVLDEIPRYGERNPKVPAFLFSTTHGKKPVCMGTKVKDDVDALMLRTLRALARKRGDDPKAVELESWVNHDIRRTVRTHLSRLRIAEEAREAVLAHVPTGIKKVYDVHDYFDEKKDALEQWAQRLLSIVEPPRDNVVKISKTRKSAMS